MFLAFYMLKITHSPIKKTKSLLGFNSSKYLNCHVSALQNTVFMDDPLTDYLKLILSLFNLRQAIWFLKLMFLFSFDQGYLLLVADVMKLYATSLK